MQVAKAIVLESTAFKVAKKYIGFLLNIPRTLFRTWFQLQVKAASVCFVIALAGLKLIAWKKSSPSPPATDNTVPKVPSEPESNGSGASTTEEPKSEDIVKNVKKLRNHVAISITKVTGDDLFWDLAILRQKSSRFNRALLEGDRRKINAARKALEAHGVFEPKPKSKAEYDRLMQEAMTDIYEFPDPVPKSTEESVSEEIVHCGQVSESGHVELQSKNMNGYIPNCKPTHAKDKSKKKVDFCFDNAMCSNEGSTCQHDFQLAMQNKLLKSRLNITNCKLEEMLKSSNSILDEVIRLNEQFSKLATVSSKISSLQYELGEGKQLLREVEEDRNEMQLKLVALEKLIKEEEEYLNELSCESGYEEVEQLSDSTDEI